MKERTILVLANSLPGLFSFRIELMERLLEEGCKVIVSCPDYMDYDRRLAELGIEFVPTGIDRRGVNPFKDLKLIMKYRGMMRKYRPDEILSYTIKPNIYGGFAAAMCGIPQLANITGLGSAVEKQGLLQKITTSLYRIGFRNTRVVFFQNKANKDFFERLRLDNCKHRLIPGSGVNLHKHSLQPYPEVDSTLHFVFISRVMKEKGIEEVFKAAEYLREKGIRAMFHVLGQCGKDYEDKLNDNVDRGLISYHGQQKDVRPFIAKAHCLIHPSYYPEGMSNVVLEACAAGRPVLTTDRPGCREPVENGVTGFLFPERDTESMLRCIDRFFDMSNDERREMGLRARAKVEREFDRNIVVEAYLEELNLFLNKKSKIYEPL